MNWLNDIVDATAESESPARFQYWSALTAISAAIKKNVYLDRYYYKLYPNLYVLLVGKSGMRKGGPVSLAKKITDTSQTCRVIVGRASIQAIIQELGKAHSLENGSVMKDASAFIVSTELSSLFVKDPDALPILTDLYDTHAHEPTWKNTLKSGKDTLKNPCVTLLGATNEAHFKESIADKDVRGGFIARTVMVLEHQRRLINDLLDPPKIVPNIGDLSDYLKRVAKISGVFTLHPGARDLYRKWYFKMSSAGNQEDETGTIERLGDTVLKVAMNISLSQGLDLVIQPGQLSEAIESCTECLAGLKQVVMGVGKSDVAYAQAMVLKYLLEREEHKGTKSQILSRYWGDFDTYILDRVIETLNQAGAITVSQNGKTTTYQLTAKATHMYSAFKREIQ